jgi:hypothetical protein
MPSDSSDSRPTRILIPGRSEPPSDTAAPLRRNEDPSTGRAYSLEEVLSAQRRHPVLFFGDSLSGKSTVLRSLFREALQGGELNLNHRESLFDLKALDEASRKKRQIQGQFARDLMNRQYYNYDRGNALAATRATEPFFIPLGVSSNSSATSVEIALMDVAGEAYSPNFTSPDMEFDKPLPADIYDLFQGYSGSISLIFLLPAAIGPEEDEARRRNNFTILSMLQQYCAARPKELRAGDFALALMTKWDLYAGYLSQANAFKPALPSEVAAALDRLYPEAWGSFRALPLSGPLPFRRAFTHYISDYFREGNPSQPDERRKRILKLHARALWNWIYGNATAEFKFSSNQRTTTRQILFPDAAPPTAGRLGWLMRLLDPLA